LLLLFGKVHLEWNEDPMTPLVQANLLAFIGHV